MSEPASTKLSCHTCIIAAELYVASQDSGMRPREAREILKNAGCAIPERTLRRYVTLIRSGRPIHSPVKSTGRPCTLTDAELEVFLGWILYQNEIKEKVSLDGCEEFIHTTFNKSLKRTALSEILKKNGFSVKRAKQTASGVQLDQAALSDILVDWNKTVHKDGLFDSLYCSIDFTYTSHRASTERMFSPRGGAQPKLKKAKSAYTNLIITCVWSDGRPRTPAVMFTYNRIFDFTHLVTKTMREKAERIQFLLRKYKIKPNRIVYVGKQVNET
jgi:transposase